MDYVRTAYLLRYNAVLVDYVRVAHLIKHTEEAVRC
jgi:hypothetical protein